MSDSSRHMHIEECLGLPLLTREGEVELFRKLDQYRQQIRQATTVIERRNGLGEEEIEDVQNCIREAARASEIIRSDLVVSNLRMVTPIAQRFANRGVLLEDLVQEGVIGLIKAVDRFNYRCGNRFATYAFWWIRQSIRRDTIEKGQSIRIPESTLEVKKVAEYEKRRIERETGEEPTIKEMASALGYRQRRLEIALNLPNNSISLETTIQGRKKQRLCDIVADDRVITPETAVSDKELTRVVENLLSKLGRREQLVLRRRYGIGMERCYTLKEVGEELSLTRERVRQIQLSALRKLKAREEPHHPKEDREKTTRYNPSYIHLTYRV